MLLFVFCPKKISTLKNILRSGDAQPLLVFLPLPLLTIEQPNFRTTSVDDIRQKLADKKEKQLVELRRIEDDIAAGRLQRPLVGQALGQPIPGEFS